MAKKTTTETAAVNGTLASAAAKALIEATVSTIAKNSLFRGAVEELGPVTASAVYKALDAFEKAAKSRKSAIRDFLLPWAASAGSLTEKGHFVATVGGFKVTNEARKSSAPEAEGLKELLSSKGIEYSEVFDEVKTLVYNPSKAKFLVDTGVLAASEIESLHSVSRALKVDAPKELTETLKQIASEK